MESQGQINVRKGFNNYRRHLIELFDQEVITVMAELFKTNYIPTRPNISKISKFRKGFDTCESLSLDW